MSVYVHVADFRLSTGHRPDKITICTTEQPSTGNMYSGNVSDYNHANQNLLSQFSDPCPGRYLTLSREHVVKIDVQSNQRH